MDKPEAVAYVQAMTACVLIEMEAMKAENLNREHRGENPAYSAKDFQDLIARYGIGHNSVLLLFQSTT